MRLPVPNKLVYSPHVYGPDVHAQSYFKAPNFPDNCVDIWHRHFGYVVTQTPRLGPAVVPGEWGGHCQPGSADARWQAKLADYFAANEIDSFYWW